MCIYKIYRYMLDDLNVWSCIQFITCVEICSAWCRRYIVLSQFWHRSVMCSFVKISIIGWKLDPSGGKYLKNTFILHYSLQIFSSIQYTKSSIDIACQENFDCESENYLQFFNFCLFNLIMETDFDSHSWSGPPRMFYFLPTPLSSFFASIPPPPHCPRPM